MSPGFMAVIMILVVLALIMSKKVPMNFVMFIVPVVCGLILGFSIFDLSNIILAQFSSVMQSAGYMLIFANFYFYMLTETGMFDTIVKKLVTMLGNKMNVIVIVVMTSVIGAVGYLTASFSTAYLVCFPLMLPLYKRYKVDRTAAFLLCQTACASIGFLPWGVGVIFTAAAAGIGVAELSEASVPWGLCVLPVIVLQWAYFTIKHKKQYGTIGLIDEGVEVVEKTPETEEEVSPNLRPKLFAVNLILFIVVLLSLSVFRIPSHMIFIFAAIVTSLINYPKNFGEIWNKCSVMILNVLISLLAISVYIALFNAAPEGGNSMVSGIADLMVSILPTFLAKYIHIIFVALCVILIRFMPYQVINAMYPVFIGMGASFGLPATAVIAPFICNLSFATSSTPFNSATFIGCNLLQIDVDDFVKRAVPFMTICNLLVIAIAWITGVLVI